MSDPRLVRAPVAVFDLDGTLTTRDTSLPFLRSVAGKRALGAGLLWAGACALPDLAVAAAAEWTAPGPRVGGVRGRWEGRLHQRVMAATLRGRHREELADQAERFARWVAEELLRADARGRIEGHRERGHRLVLASSSLDLYVEPLGALLGFGSVVGTRLDFDRGVATGRLLGLPCWGAEKLRRVLAILGPEAGGIDYAYGNGRGDGPLVEAARHPAPAR